MALTPEEETALEWQRTRMKRRAFQRSLQALLKAPSEPAARVKKNWAPLTRTGEIKGQADG